VIDKPGVGTAPYYYIKQFVERYGDNVSVYGFDGGTPAFDPTFANKRTESYFRIAHYYIDNMTFPTDHKDWQKIKNDVTGGLAVQKYGFTADNKQMIPEKRTLLTKGLKDDSIVSFGYLDFADALALSFYVPRPIVDKKNKAGDKNKVHRRQRR
jgi:hypothetical protein